ncbi:CPBP family glutamic-type intramembrane protease [Opitutus terrae]|uniref:CAAX prenyl protease 2/Lysostaphin resistance protein A-like domain-containing protein n=1 Tax=Opitutus terrae (strain DSM 11246 / JCM 15787 / PB90-1) TaxID=452637 RepID=B1ZPP2_OPITP|nr:CPBP family glutamic-type intramembrane protease [Opitutus terrae]ACB75495.1 hypothetical protein Oter_2212 [Opitutus terrae PB90-1]
MAILLNLLFDLPHRTDLRAMGMVRRFVEMVVLAPFFETLLLQALPVGAVRIFDGGFRAQLLAGWLMFAVAHLVNGLGSALVAGLVGGFYLSFTYTHWRTQSFRSALWMTCSMHALYNLVLFATIAVLVPQP